MSPIFKSGDVVLVNRLSYIFSKPKIGDLVVLKRDLPRHGKAGKYIIKRITEINPSADGNIFFVTGDNEKESTDSRIFGWVSKKEIVGKVIF